jgi:hypothetical protein
MYKIMAAVMLLALARTAPAREYYIAYHKEQPKHSWVELIDPSSITTTNGITTARSLTIHSMDLWNDETVQYNCSSKQYNTVTSLMHMASGTVIDRSNLPDVGKWQSISPSSLDELVLTEVCNWSTSKMVGDSVFHAPDLDTAAHLISGVLFEVDYNTK